MPELVHLPADVAREELVETVARDGAAIVDALIPERQVARTLDELMPYIEATGAGADDFSGRRTTRTGALVPRSAAARELVCHPLIVSAARAFLAPYCERIQLHLTQVIRIRPGQPAQAIHRDRWAWGIHLRHLEPQWNTIWAMTPFRSENGATQVVPGSVDWPDDRIARPEEITTAEMSPGSVLVYSGSVFHGGGENRSKEDRIGINLTYALGWLRQEENHYLGCPPEIARSLDPELQELLGYALGSYALGYYSPPLAPGEGPEVVSPAWALGRRGDASDPKGAASGGANGGATGASAGGELGSSELLERIATAVYSGSRTGG